MPRRTPWLWLAALLLCAATAPVLRGQAQAANPPAGQTASAAEVDTRPPAPVARRADIASDAYLPITLRGRMQWFVAGAIGPRHLAIGVFTAGFGTAVDRPKEYGAGWGGFGDRFGMRMTGVVTSNAMEASAGALWGEDPRYFPDRGSSFVERVKNVVKQTFEARRSGGEFAPAYARFLAIPGSNFLANTWRVPSEANTHAALLRTGEGFAGHMAANALREFWPDARGMIRHRGK